MSDRLAPFGLRKSVATGLWELVDYRNCKVVEVETPARTYWRLLNERDKRNAEWTKIEQEPTK